MRAQSMQTLIPVMLLTIACVESQSPDEGHGASSSTSSTSSTSSSSSGTLQSSSAADCSTCGPQMVCIAGSCRPGPAQQWSTSARSYVSGDNGQFTVEVEITDERSFLVTATTQSAAGLSLVRVNDPQDVRVLRWQDWYNSPEGLTKAFFPTEQTVVFNWPIRASDPPLVPGVYKVQLGAYESDGVTGWPGIAVDATVIKTRDAALDAGLIRVVIVYANGLSGDAALVAATESAVARWREVWAGAGMHIEVRYASSTVNPILPVQGTQAASALTEAVALADGTEVLIIIGEMIVEAPRTYGIAGQIPGPLIATTLTGVIVGWLANAGGDGEFSEDDVLIYGEVLAHEAGHYLGLFHPVEWNYNRWDALTDTPACTTQDDCESALGLNLMFPYSICDGATCLHATSITDEQRAVLQRYTGSL